MAILHRWCCDAAALRVRFPLLLLLPLWVLALVGKGQGARGNGRWATGDG